MHFLFGFLLSTISLFLILLVLVQRGRGGGLTGALGGMGGQSAFGTKAGDTFTRVTIVAATVWILTAILAVKLLGGKAGPLGDANAATLDDPTTNVAPGTSTNPLEGLLPSEPAGSDAEGTAPAGTDADGTGAGGADAGGAASDASAPASTAAPGTTPAAEGGSAAEADPE